MSSSAGASAGGGRREHPVAAGPPAVARPARHQVADVHGERGRIVRSVLPAPGVGVDLEPAGALLAVQDGDGAEVGVRADAELAGQGRPEELGAGVPVDVEPPGGVAGVPGEMVRLQAQGGGQQLQQLVGEGPHRGEVLRHQPAQVGHFGRPGVGPEPFGVHRRVPGRVLCRAGPGLLEVGRGGRALRVAVGLGARAEPPPAADPHGVRGLGGDREPEERARRLADPRGQLRVHPVPGHQQEPGRLERLVHAGGGAAARLGSAGPPRAEIDHGDLGTHHGGTCFPGRVGAARAGRPCGAAEGPGRASPPGAGRTGRCLPRCRSPRNRLAGALRARGCCRRPPWPPAG